MNIKLPFILFFALVLCGNAHAQYVSVHAEDPTNPGGTQTIVRSWNSSYVVSYYVDASLNPTMDVVEQSTGTIYRAVLPGNVYIRDMYIDQTTDVLYFCGATMMYPGDWQLYTGYGIIGWIKLHNFFSSYIKCWLYPF